MFIELTDHLRCPADHEESYLVLLPDEIRERSVRAGRLGCPVGGGVDPEQIARIVQTEEEESDEAPKLDIKFKTGDRVTWTFEGGFHNVKSTSDNWDVSSPVPSEDPVPYTFTAPGDYRMFVQIRVDGLLHQVAVTVPVTD